MPQFGAYTAITALTAGDEFIIKDDAGGTKRIAWSNFTVPNGSVTGVMIGFGEVLSFNLANDSVETAKIEAGAVTLAKMDSAALEAPVVMRAVALATDLVAASSTVLESFPLPFDCDFSSDPELYIDAGPTGSAAIFDIHLDGVTIMTTDKLSVDAGENSSTTAATPPALTTTSGTKGQIVTILCDQVGLTTPGTGAVVTMFMQRTA